MSFSEFGDIYKKEGDSSNVNSGPNLKFGPLTNGGDALPNFSNYSDLGNKYGPDKGKNSIQNIADQLNSFDIKTEKRDWERTKNTVLGTIRENGDIDWSAFDVNKIHQYSKSHNLNGDKRVKLIKDISFWLSHGYNFDTAFNKAINKESITKTYVEVSKENNNVKGEILDKIANSINNGEDIWSDDFKIKKGDTFFSEDVNIPFTTDESGEQSIKLNDLPENIVGKEELRQFIVQAYKERITSLIESVFDKPGHDANWLTANLFSTSCKETLKAFEGYIKSTYEGNDEKISKILSSNFKIKEEFKAFCALIGYKVDNVDDEILNNLKELEKKQSLIRAGIERFNRERNKNRIVKNLNYSKQLDNNNGKYINLQNASGTDIAKNYNLGKKVPPDFNPKLDGISEGYRNQRLKRLAFNGARTNFLKNNSILFNDNEGKNIGISSIITEKVMLGIFDIESDNPSINIENLNNFLSKIKYSDNDKGKIRSTLMSFTEEFDKTLGELSTNSNDRMGHIHETVNNHAIGAVIDNVKNIFSEIGENLKQGSKIVGFKFNEKEPAEIIDNDLVISGVLDGATINIRYNLLSGQLYMNSFVDESKGARPVITVGNTEANKPIGLFIPYKDILDNYYQPTNNINNFQNVLRQKIENVGDIVQKDIKSQSKKNSVVSKFLRTFNILKDGGSNPPLYFEGGGNLFDALQCINNSDSATLDKFQDFMYYMMEEYAGLKRGKNNESQKQDWSDKIFTRGTNEDKINEDEVDKDGKLFIDKMGQFKDEKVKLGQKNQFGIGDSLGFADIINTKLSQGDPPDKKLSIQKMDSFKKNIDECSTKNILKALDNI